MTKRTDKVYKEIGKRIYDARIKRKWTQEELSTESTITSTGIGFIEQGRRQPTLATIIKLADALGVPLEDLFRKL